MRSNESINGLDLDAFSKAWLSEKPLLQMMKEFEIYDTRQVKRIAKSIGLPDRTKYRSKFRLYFNEFILLYNRGLSYKQISKRLGVGPLTLFAWRKKLGLPPRAKGGLQVIRSKEQAERLHNYVNTNGAVFVHEAAKQLSMSKLKIKKIVDKSKSIDSFKLSIPANTRIYYKASNFFGDNLEKVILFKKGDWNALTKKLIEVISPEVSKNVKDRDWKQLHLSPLPTSILHLS